MEGLGRAETLATGKDIIEQGMEQPALGYVEVPGDVPKNAFAMKVTGDCMEPGLKENDVMIIVPTSRPKSGDVVTVCYRGQFYTKRYTVLSGKRYLVPDNRSYPSTEIGPEHEIVGKVIRTIREL